MNILNRKQHGLGLIEVLASLVVLSVGLLSVGTLHIKLIANSNDNKAKSEAIIIAQSRIEEMRNFSDNITTKDEFNDHFLPINRGNDTSVSGVNANFTRTETIIDANNTKGIAVYVSWYDKNNENKEVLVNSSIAWQKPRSSGESTIDDFEPLIKSTTGKAKLGEGTIDPSDSNIITTPTGDGLFIYNNIDNHSRLGDEEGNIVLTLTDACDLGTGACTDFVKISGRVYIDNASQGSLQTGEIFVKASDAAYCQQFYFDNNGNPIEVNSINNGSMETSPSSNYRYYNYKCYLGGGWHGNIGLILTGGIGQSDKVCQGDPTSMDAYADPVISARRVYRGMIYKHNGSGTAYVNASNDPIYYSIGVADALVLPESGDSGHDFVISSLNVNDTTGDNCISKGVMVRADSYYDPDGVSSITPGKLFEGVPTDFYCLNQNSTYVDSFDSSQYAMNNSCPFDPSDPPSERHIISGRVLINTNLDIDSDIANIFVNTSDGSGNCRIATFTKPTPSQYSINYECDVYDWGSGWNGYVQLNTDYSIMACDHYRETYAGVLNDFNADDNICNTGGILTVEGSAIPYNSKKLVQAETTDAGGQCQITNDGANYSCNSDLMASDTQWTGRLTFTSSNGSKLCISDPVLSTGTFLISDGASNSAWIDLVGIDPGNIVLPLQVIASNGTCP